MTDDEIKDILKRIRVIASVGLSADETKDSFGVATYLKRARYTMVPVNPRADRILGSKAYPDLASVPIKVDAVQVFRPSSEAMKIVEDAIKIGAAVVWMQEGIIDEAAAAKARAAGLAVVMDRCMMQEHRRLMGTPMQ